MSKLHLTELLPSVQYVTMPDGQRVAVLDADEWEDFVAWLEDIEDQQIIENAWKRLKKGPEAAGAVSLESVLDEL